MCMYKLSSSFSLRMIAARLHLHYLQIVLALLYGGVLSSPPPSVSFGVSTESPRSNLVSDPHALHDIIQVSRQLLECCPDESRTMNLHFLQTSGVTCNDGSQAGYYLRKSQQNSRIWIIFLEGGWYCYDRKSCSNRWNRLRHLMTSKEWPQVRSVGGILSPNADENPFWWNANHVFVPYCSSDSWSGTRGSPPSDDVPYRFQGSEIVLAVVRQLLPLGLTNASSLILAGSSAGGTGVLVNVDRVRDLLHRRSLGRVHVRGVADSGWFLDRDPYPASAHRPSPTPTPPPNPMPLQLQPLAPLEAIRRGWELWDGRVPEACRERHANDPWRCYFGYRVYPTLKVPVFVFQWLFDEAQMTADNVGAPVTKQQWDFIHQMGDSLRNSFHNVTAVFAPSCISHSVLTRRDWRAVRVDEVSLPQALRCWEAQPYSAQMRAIRRAHAKFNLPMLGDAPLSRNFTASSSDPQSLERPRRKRKKHNNNNRRSRGGENPRRKRKGRRNNNNNNHNHMVSNRPNVHQTRQQKRRQRQASFSNTNTNSSNNKNNNHHHHHHQHANACHLHLVERCSWPQCNRSCPKLHNPFTGEEMDFIELLKSFGLDMASVANALGIDLHTLDNMDPAELLSLLTQQAS